MNALTPIIERTREDVAARERATPLQAVRRAGEARLSADPPRDFAAALRAPGISVIAEHKRSSPSAGVIRDDLVLKDVVGAYERGGAAALSVLTEEHSFAGSLEDLAAARAAATLPILRKDFTVDPYQLYEARAAGADAILLVVGSLTDEQLGRLYTETRALDLDALVEIHDEEELERALEFDVDVIGINNRDLTDFTVDLTRTFDLLADVPAGKTVVSESGIVYREQVEELERVGVDAVLVGETVMRAEDPEVACRALTGVDDV